MPLLIWYGHRDWFRCIYINSLIICISICFWVKLARIDLSVFYLLVFVINLPTNNLVYIVDFEVGCCVELIKLVKLPIIGDDDYFYIAYLRKLDALLDEILLSSIFDVAVILCFWVYLLNALHNLIFCLN